MRQIQCNLPQKTCVKVPIKLCGNAMIMCTEKEVSRIR